MRLALCEQSMRLALCEKTTRLALCALTCCLAAATSAQTVTVSRSAIDAAYQQNGTVRFALAVHLDGAPAPTQLTLEETLPGGWQFGMLLTGPTPDVAPAIGDMGTVSFVFDTVPDTPFTLQYSAIASGGSIGLRTLTGRSSIEAGGDTLAFITPETLVPQSPATISSVELTRDAGDFLPGQPLDVTLTVNVVDDGLFDLVRVTERPPAGWTFDGIVSSSPSASASVDDPDAGTLRFFWGLGQATNRVTYRVTPPLDAAASATLAGQATYRPSGEDQEASPLRVTQLTQGIPEGEGVAEGEGTAEGEGLPEGEPEGAPEGEPEGEGTPPCTLDMLTLTAPENRSTFFVGRDISAFTLSLDAEVDCPEDTASVQFFNRALDNAEIPAEDEPFPFVPADLNNIATDTTAPFSAVLPSVFTDTTYAAIAQGNSTTFPDEPLQVGTIYSIAEAGSMLDADDNAIPDNPFTTLDRAGDRWLAATTLAGATAQRLVAAAAVYPPEAGTSARTRTLTLQSPSDAGVLVNVRYSEDLVLSDEVGYLQVAIAPTLADLLPQAEADILRPEPAGALPSGGQYIDVQFVLSDDGGQTFFPVAPTRLSANPIQLSVAGLNLDSAQSFVLAQHPTTLSSTENGFAITGETGDFGVGTLSAASVDAAAGSASANVLNLGTVAVFQVVDGGDGGGPGNDQGLIAAYLGIIFIIIFFLGLAAL